MLKYGINKVRGGVYSKYNLEENQIKKLKIELEIMSKHYTLKLPSLPPEFIINPVPKAIENPKNNQENQKVKQNVNQKVKQNVNQKVNQIKPKKELVKMKIEVKNANGTCYKCGQDGHYQDNCNYDSELEFDTELEFD
jgi:hypothetical protein